MTYAEETWQPLMWRDNKTETSYEISSFGNIRSWSWYKQGELLQPYRTRLGYNLVQIKHDSQRWQPTVHSIVMRAFVGPRPHKLVINHLDGDKDCNAVWNLEYTTQSKNMKHAFKMGLMVHNMVSLDLAELLRLREAGMSYTNIALLIGNVSPLTIWRRVNGVVVAGQ